MWVSRREWARHQRELQTALKRAEQAEKDLASERQSKDWLMLQLASRLVTKSGQYGLDHEPLVKRVESPRRFVQEPSELDLARLEYYKQCFRNDGKSEDEAEALWEAEMRGETPFYPYELAEAE